MKLRTTLLAALLLVLFGAYVYYFEHKKPQEKKAQEDQEKAVFNIDWEKVSGLSVQNPEGTFVFEKQPDKAEGSPAGIRAEGEWRIQQPVRTEADSLAVNGLVSTLKNLKIDQVVTDSPEDLGVFGLQSSRMKIGVVLEEGESPRPLLVGDKSPVGVNSYAMREGENKVLLVSTDLSPHLSKRLIDFREKKLFSFKREDVEQIRVFHKGSSSLELAKEEGQWKIRHPIQARAAESGMNDLLNKLTNLHANSFLAEEAQDLNPYGLSEPAWRVEVVLAPDHAQATILLGGTFKDEKNSESIYAKRGETPMVVSLRNDLVSSLEQKPEEFREKKVFPFKNWDVGKIDLAWGDQRATLMKTDQNQWRITEPLQARAASGKVTSFLSALSRLEAEDFLEGPSTDSDRAGYGLADPVLKVTLYKEVEEKEGEKGEEAAGRIGTILFGQPQGDAGHCYAAVEGDEVLYSVQPDLLEKELPENVEALREKKLLSFYRYQVDLVESKGLKGTVVLQRKEGNWEIRKPKSGQAEEKDVNSLLDVLSDLEADRFSGNAPADLSPYGLASPECRIVLQQELEKEKPKILGTLLLADKGPEGDPDHTYAMAEGDGWIGLVHKDKKSRLLEALAPFLQLP